MLDKMRVTIRITLFQGPRQSLTSSRLVYAAERSELCIPLDKVLDCFPQTPDEAVAATKTKKK